jgi:hypothetical protein
MKNLKLKENFPARSALPPRKVASLSAKVARVWYLEKLKTLQLEYSESLEWIKFPTFN